MLLSDWPGSLLRPNAEVDWIPSIPSARYLLFLGDVPEDSPPVQQLQQHRGVGPVPKGAVSSSPGDILPLEDMTAVGF